MPLDLPLDEAVFARGWFSDIPIIHFISFARWKTSAITVMEPREEREKSNDNLEFLCYPT